ncbi:MAG TPA: hypothetical protein VMN57_11890 [Anaerolineales bacterium]|nr:hypothetical protein [Anaerolineales bacterium]
MPEQSHVPAGKKTEAGAPAREGPFEERPAAEDAVMKLQHQVGNRAVQRLVREAGANTQRQSAPVAEEEEEPINTAGLGVRGTTPGHGDLGNEDRPPPPDVQRQGGGGGGGVSANLTYTKNNPTIIRKPAADIASGHGQADAAGWTTPKYNIAVPFANPTRIDINVSLDFDMELASEYTGATLSVLQDHENGHVNIGREKGQTHLVDDLESSLESNAALSRPIIQAAVQSASNTFVSEEQTESQRYDAVDYPRMHQAYLGARTPLADLESASGSIRNAAAKLRSFIGGVTVGTQGQAAIFANDATDACQALSTNDLSVLQYNPEFKSLVASARTKIDEYIESFQYDFWIIEFSLLTDTTRSALGTLAMALNAFTWSTPV